MPQYDMGPFYGAVCLKDWFQDPMTGRSLRSLLGVVKILEVKDMIGFDPGKSEANWIARVEGDSRSYNIPGCQVRAVITLESPGVPHEAAADAMVVP